MVQPGEYKSSGSKFSQRKFRKDKSLQQGSKQIPGCFGIPDRKGREV
jgi:hypothetical protein